MFDYKYDTKVKDWVFDANRDYAGVSGIDVIRQRIMARLFIRRGGFIYDQDGNLGSRLYDLMNATKPNLQQEIQVIVVEALSDMRDITVEGVQVRFAVSEDDPRETQVHLDIAVNPAVFGGFDIEQAPVQQSLNLVLP